ncbi:MAG: hypothetical protein IIU14_07285 [Ruminococcus sp.]|nr:hypothetical protein [Ruminococcus sp.]
MITIKNDGRFIIPEGEAFIGYAGDNLSAEKRFFVEGITDPTLIFRMYLLFDDGSSNFFLLDSQVENGGTTLVWDVTNDQIYKSGIVQMQIKASNSGGLVFHTSATPLLVQSSIEFAESYAEKVNSEFLQHEQLLNELCERCEDISDEADATLAAIRNEKPFSTSDLRDGCITRAKLHSSLGEVFDEYCSTDFISHVELGDVGALNAFNSAQFTAPTVRYTFVLKNPLAFNLGFGEGYPAELVYNNGYQRISLLNHGEARYRKVNSVSPSFSADSWAAVPRGMRAECLSRFNALEGTVGTLNTELENTLNGV